MTAAIGSSFSLALNGVLRTFQQAFIALSACGISLVNSVQRFLGYPRFRSFVI